MATTFERVIIITGGAKGIGAATARQISAPSTAIVINYNTSSASAASLVSELLALGAGAALAIQADVSTPEGAAKLIDETVARFGTITGLVNNAGVYEPAPIATTTPEQIRRTIDANVFSFLYVTASAVRHIADGGSVVNVSSAMTRVPFPHRTTYTASKGAMDAYTRALAVELGPRKIRVNAVLPGITKTDMTTVSEEAAAKMTPFGEIGKPEDVAAAIVFLLDPKSRWITGQSIGASGGIAFSY
ncbi:hypothetical protein DFJ73DRAFT_581770 [Zopfochytrium polystomum]|nr:hypothetical protein DFJ73DRAFT_581770 [Zopfochytrium polystomum]